MKDDDAATTPTLMFAPLKPGSAWIKITYNDVIDVIDGEGASMTPTGDKAKYRGTSKTLRFTVEKVVEAPITLP